MLTHPGSSGRPRAGPISSTSREETNHATKRPALQTIKTEVSIGTKRGCLGAPRGGATLSRRRHPATRRPLAIFDRHGKHGRIRTAAVPAWVRQAIEHRPLAPGPADRLGGRRPRPPSLLPAPHRLLRVAHLSQVPGGPLPKLPRRERYAAAGTAAGIDQVAAVRQAGVGQETGSPGLRPTQFARGHHCRNVRHATADGQAVPEV